MTSRFLLALGIVMLLAAAMATVPAAQAQSDSQSGAALDPGLAAKGKALYAEHCSHCHGFNMVNPGNVSFDLREFPHDDKARFVHSVTMGKNNRMPSWGDLLKIEEIDAIWVYICTGGKG